MTLVPTYADPYRAGRHPFQTYLLLLATVAGMPLIFGKATAGSVNALLPEWLAASWGLALVVGCLVALAGTYWPVSEQPATAADFATALTLERIGLSVVGPAAILYAILIPLYVGWAGLLSAAIVAGFGWAAWRRRRDVARVFDRALREGSPDAD